MSDQEFAAQESAPAVTPESAPAAEEQNVQPQEQAEEQQVTEARTNTEGQQVTEASTNTEGVEGAEPVVPLKQLISQRKKRQLAEQEAAYWRGQAEAKLKVEAETTKPAQPQVQTQVKPPDLNDYETYEEFERAKDEYILTQAEQRVAQRLYQQQQAVRQQQQQATFQQKLREAAEADPTINDILQDNTVPISPVMVQLLQRTDEAPQLIKWFGANKEQAAKIYRMDPVSAALEMGRIEATLKSTPKPQPKKVSAAPAPIQTVKTTAPASIDEDDLPMEEYYKRRTKQLYRR